MLQEYRYLWHAGKNHFGALLLALGPSPYGAKNKNKVEKRH